MSAESTPREVEGERTGGHSVTIGGVTTVKKATDTWVTAAPSADATKPSTLPKAVANFIDGKDHSNDPVFPDQGGQVLDGTAAAANNPESE